MSTLRILIADDHDVIRRGLKTVLETHPGWIVCGEAHTGREAVAKSEELKPDVVILDVNMPEMSGLDAVRKIREILPKTETLMLSLEYSDQLVAGCIDAGARGYMIKADAGTQIVSAVEALGNHKPFFTPRVKDAVLGENAVVGDLRDGRRTTRERLTAREREVVRLISEGKHSREVSATLGISVKTVETHRANIMRKLDIHCMGDLVRYALRNRLIDA
jgi:DNA-binding NarL/FixJ family response regulator